MISQALSVMNISGEPYLRPRSLITYITLLDCISFNLTLLMHSYLLLFVFTVSIKHASKHNILQIVCTKEYFEPVDDWCWQAGKNRWNRKRAFEMKLRGKGTHIFMSFDTFLNDIYYIEADDGSKILWHCLVLKLWYFWISFHLLSVKV